MITKPRILLILVLSLTSAHPLQPVSVARETLATSSGSRNHPSPLLSSASQPQVCHPMEWAEVHTYDADTCGVFSIQGRRPTMEDATVVTEVDNKKFYGVFDGHGGDTASAFVADHIADTLAEALESEATIPEALEKAFVKTEAAYKKSETPDSGTTAVTALVDGTTLYIANAGDSRAVLCQDGKAVILSDDHKPSRADEKARIEKCGGFVFTYPTPIGPISRVNGILSTSRSIGDFPLKPMVSAVPEVTTHELTDTSEFLILACDGLWDTVTAEEAVAIARKELTAGVSANDAARALVAEAFARQDATSWQKGIGIWDNTTVMVVLLGDASSPSKDHEIESA